MALALGQASYVGIAQQAGPVGFGGALVATGLKTFPNLGGSVVKPTAGKAARESITTLFPRPGHIYNTVSLVPVSLAFEVVTDPTAFKPLLLGAWGQRLRSGTTPNFVDTYTAKQPFFDAAADADPQFYNHTLSWHAFLSDGTTTVAKYSVKDVVITQMSWTGEANKATRLSFQGTGRNLAVSASSVAYSDQAGTVLSWDRAASSTPGGLYMDATSQSTRFKVRQFEFVLSNPHTFETGIGDTVGAEMFPPFRTSRPTAVLNYSTFFESASYYDPIDAMDAFIAGTAVGFILNYRVGVQDYMMVQAASSTEPAFFNEPDINWGPNGPVGFSSRLDIFPDNAATDLKMELGSSSGT